MSLLEQARNKQVTAWMPETAGEGIEGKVLSVTRQESDFQAGVMVPTVTLLTEKGERYSVVGYRSVLRKEIEQERPSPGDQMAVVYAGTDKLKKGKFAGKDVHVYRVVVEHQNTAADTNGNSQPQPDKVPF